MKRGEPAPFDGVLLSKPLFNELAPCFANPIGEKEFEPAVVPIPRGELPAGVGNAPPGLGNGDASDFDPDRNTLENF